MEMSLINVDDNRFAIAHLNEHIAKQFNVLLPLRRFGFG